MELSAHKNSKKQGDVGVGVAIGWFASQGHTVCIPLTDSQDYDLVVDMGGLWRVQVKTTTCIKKGKYEATLRVCGGNRSGTGRVKKFSAASVDFVFVLTGGWDKYLIPSKVIDGKGAVSLCSRYEQYRVV